MDDTEAVAVYLAELRARFGDDWHTRPFWLSSDDRGARIGWGGITFYIWRDRILRAQNTERKEHTAP